jgi:poly(3-hydroxybutyrate) depolymerase
MATGGAGGGVSGAGGVTGGGAGSGSGGTSGTGTGGSTGTDPVKSAGCGKAKTLPNGTIDITFDGNSRNYILRVPEGYDNSHPYRLVFAFAESGSSAESVADRDYFRLATLDSENTVFVAPDAENGMGSWSQSDVELTDAILAELEADLCIDKTRIFATGFSFGGAMSLALACTRADVFRGVAFFSGADLTGSCTGTLTKPIAYYASQASGDSSGDPAPTSGRVKQAQFAEVNGCMPEPNATTFPAAGQPHSCTEYQGCSAGHPTKYCVFDGPHGWEPTDPGDSMSWNPPEAWTFITQF